MSIRHALCTQRIPSSSAKFLRCGKIMVVFNSHACPVFPEGTNGREQAFYRDCGGSPFAFRSGTPFRVNGITVITSVQLDEGANGAFHFKDTCPSIDGGRFPAKRIVGERAEVWADLDRDGHDVSAEHEWHRAPMTHHSGDRWFFAFIPEQACLYCDAIEAWTDEFAMWRPTYAPKRQAGDGVAVDTVEDAGMLTRAQAGGPDATAVNLRQCETLSQTGDAAALLTDKLDEA